MKGRIVQYSECTPIEPKLANMWLVRPNQGKLRLVVTDPSLGVERVVDMMKLTVVGGFTIQAIDVGEFTVGLPVKMSYYSRDARQVTHNLRVVGVI